jgi:multidrug efflux pump subunit AcrB
MPGATPADVEQRVTRPMEQLLWEVPGVEYVYSTSSAGQSRVVVRFTVGEAEEAALVRLNQKLAANADRIPPGVIGPIVKPRSIDDVPILAVTVWSERYGDDQLRALAAQLRDAIAEVTDVSEVTLIGGRPRQVSVDVDPARLAAYGLDPLAVQRAIGETNAAPRRGASGPDRSPASKPATNCGRPTRFVVSWSVPPAAAPCSYAISPRSRTAMPSPPPMSPINHGRPGPNQRSRSPSPSARGPTPSTSRIT